MRAYHALLRDIMANGEGHADRTRTGTRSVFGRQFRHDLRDGFPLLTTKKLPLRWIAEELFWFLSGSTDNAVLKAQGVDIWDEWATAEQCAKFGREANDLGPIYGWQWRHFGADYVPLHHRTPFFQAGGVDQLANLIDGIVNTPNSRRLIVSGWHPRQQGEVELPPCHTLWQIKCHEETRQMSLELYARSIDSFLGLPFNIASYALLLFLLARVTGYSPRELVISFGDVHVYSNHFNQVAEQLERTPYGLPILMTKRDFPKSKDPLADLLAVRWEHLDLMGYVHYPKLSAPVAI